MKMSKSKRAFRRHHMLRLKRYYQQTHFWSTNCEKPDPVLVGMRSKTPHPCSCFLCGHRRLWYGASLAERKNQLGFEEQLSEL